MRVILQIEQMKRDKRKGIPDVRRTRNDNTVFLEKTYLMISLHHSIMMTKMRRKRKRSCTEEEHRIS